MQSPHAQFAEGLCSYVIKTNIKFFPKKFKGCHQDCHQKELHHLQIQNGKFWLLLCLLCSSLPCPVLATGRAKSTAMRSLYTDSPCQQFSRALLSTGEEESQGLIPLGLVQEKWLTSFDQQSGVLISVISCSADYERVGQSRRAGSRATHAGRLIPQLENHQSHNQKSCNWKQMPAFCCLVLTEVRISGPVGSPRFYNSTMSAAALRVTIKHNVHVLKLICKF